LVLRPHCPRSEQTAGQETPAEVPQAAWEAAVVVVMVVAVVVAAVAAVAAMAAAFLTGLKLSSLQD